MSFFRRLSRPGRFAPGLFLFAVFCVLFAAPALAFDAEKLHGAWVVDIPATIGILEQKDAFTDAGEKAELEAELATWRMIIDVPGKLLSRETLGKNRRDYPLLSITETPDGFIRLEMDERFDDVTLGEDGLLRVRDVPVAFKREE